jgi:uncharacterized protein YidB (DUF937 family)
MGFFDSIVGGVQKLEQQGALVQEVGKMVNDAGGVNGLMQQFEQNGLGGIIKGWVANGSNPPITADQIIQVVGQDRVTEIASKVGMSEQQVADGIAKILPMIIDHLTPNGNTQAAPAGGVAAATSAVTAKLAGS